MKRRSLLSHDHRPCVAASMSAAEALARQRRLRLTPRRREVLRIVARSHRPLGAYEVLAALARSGGESPKPPTVYRALDFLLAHGLVHRIDSRNAFVACFRPARAHRAHFFLCESCGCASEVQGEALGSAVAACAREAGFTVRRETVELIGRCRSCA
jgi:Fur family zinc uptake transcriptional regulator